MRALPTPLPNAVPNGNDTRGTTRTATPARNLIPSVPRSIDVRRKALRAVARGLATPIPTSYRRPVEAVAPTVPPSAVTPCHTHVGGDDLGRFRHSEWLDVEREVEQR